MSVIAEPYSIPADGHSFANVAANLRDYAGDLVEDDDRLVTFTIINGGESGELIEPTTVMSQNGIAYCTLEATYLPGTVSVEVSSPGLESDTVDVEVTGTYWCQDITSNTTWTFENSPYIVTCDVCLCPGFPYTPRLTIEAGVTVRFASGAGLKIAQGGTYSGELHAIGTADLPITFTSISGSSGGWDGIYFDDGSDTYDAYSVMEHCMIENAGQAGWGHSANIYCHETSEPTLRHTIIRNSSGVGIRIHGSLLDSCTVAGNMSDGIVFADYATDGVVKNSIITANGGDGVASEGAGHGSGSIESCVFTGNVGAPIRVWYPYYFMLSGNSYSGNGVEAILVEGGTSAGASVHWSYEASGEPYHVMVSSTG
jgi:hypothetical protein